MLEDADGSLLVVDTGGWYKLCCPTSQLVKPDVLGGIYRVRKTGSHKVSDPRGGMVNWKTSSPANLTLLLGDSRPVWRRRAIESLADRGPAAVKAIEPILSDTNSKPAAALSAVWAACRIDGIDARRAVRHALKHDDATVRQAAIHAVSVWRDQEAVPALTALLQSSSAHNRRAAAEALGRIGDPTATAALLNSVAGAVGDRALNHSLTYALIELGENTALREAASSDNPCLQRSALVALDQSGAKLDAKVVIDHLDDTDTDLRNSARWIASRHAEWDTDLVAYLRTQVGRADVGAGRATTDRSAREAGQKRCDPAALGRCGCAACASSPGGGRMALAAMAASGLKELPPVWLAALQDLFSGNSPRTDEALAIIRAIPPTKSNAGEIAATLLTARRLGGFSRNPSHGLVARSGRHEGPHAGQFDVLLTSIDREQPSNLRGTAADVLSKAKLSPAQLHRLAAAMPKANPLELDRLLAAFAQSSDEAVGLKLLESLRADELRGAATVEAIKQRLVKYSPTVQAEAQKLYALINAEYEQQSARLEETLHTLPPGDYRRGQAIFNSTRVSCRNCHTIGYVGGKIGPDLTSISRIRQPRDLVESILFPSASFVRSYEPVMIRTSDGQVHSGNIKTDAPDEIVLTLAADKEIRLVRGEVEEMRPGKVSVMPAGLDKQLSLQELADLVEFLKNCK